MWIFLKMSLVSRGKLALLRVRLESGNLGNLRETKPLDCTAHSHGVGARGDRERARKPRSSLASPHGQMVCRATACSVHCPSTRGSSAL